MDRISNGWRIAKSSWAVLAKDRELIAIPIVAGIAAVLAFAAIAVPGFLLLGDNEAADPALWLIGALALVAASWVSAIGQAAVMAGAAERMDGGNPTVGSAYARASARVGRLLEWAVLATVVAIVLDQIEARLGILGKVVSWIGSIAFSVLSFLALPVIVFEDVGAIEAFKRSSRLLRATWGEQLTFNFGMGLVGLVAILPAVLVGVGLLSTGIVVIQVIAVVALAGWIITVVAVTSALSAVFKAALYRWANGLPVDPSFVAGDFSTAFRRR